MLFFQYTAAAMVGLIGCGLALPITFPGEVESDDSNNSTAVSIQERAMNGGLLRIMPVGASIMWGSNADKISGLRQSLKGRLMNDPGTSFDVNFVGVGGGKNADGSYKGCYKGKKDVYNDNECAAFPGKTIWEVSQELPKSYRYKPNIIIINVGTNNCVRNRQPERADFHMRNLIEKLMNNNAGGFDTALYVLSTLPPFADKVSQNLKDCRKSVNDQYRRLVTTMQGEGKFVRLADLAYIGLKHPEHFTGANGKDDNWHPNDAGYEKVGKAFFDVIMDNRGSITPPLPRDW